MTWRDKCREADRIATCSEEELNQICRDQGLDPEQLAADARRVIGKAVAQAKAKCEAEGRSYPPQLQDAMEWLKKAAG